ncbi:unnamed protein product [Rotaria sordida]|uniref:Tubulin-tyrosine ligase n=1 Tax=Rotaria sordida TaxID=392033 RepID=A0A818T785_9BILA|nr:unnamed protein product [Rotaria sordida]
MTIKNTSTKDNIYHFVNAKINGYYVLGKNNSQLVRDQLDLLGFNRYDSLPIGGVKFNWITRSADIDWKTFDSNFQILNHIYNERQLSNKGLLLTNLKNYEMTILKNKRFNEINTNKTRLMPSSNIDNYLSLKTFLPETYLLDNTNDRITFKKIFKDGSTWICKPVGLSCGREVFIFRSQQQLENLLNEYHKNSRNNHYCTLYYNRLVQKYIENPLLINKHKFDIRTYLLCICISNEILCFAAQTGYLRLSMYKYDLENMNKFIHLTNQSIQIKNKVFSSVKHNTGMTMDEFNEYFNEYIQPNMPYIKKGWVLNELPEKITKILNQVADSVRNKLSIREGCFGFYGVDILIDEKLNCWLLEINSGPTLDMTNAALEKVIPICLNAALNIVIESLDNYRSLGSVFPLHSSNIFKYLLPSNPPVLSPIISNQIPIFTSLNTHRIDLTPGVLVSFHRYRRLPLLSHSKSPNHFSKSVLQKIKLTQKKSTPVRSQHQSIIHNVIKKMDREHLSHQLTEFIRMNNKPIILNNKLHEQDSIIHSILQ